MDDARTVLTCLDQVGGSVFSLSDGTFVRRPGPVNRFTAALLRVSALTSAQMTCISTGSGVKTTSLGELVMLMNLTTKYKYRNHGLAGMRGIPTLTDKISAVGIVHWGTLKREFRRLVHLYNKIDQGRSSVIAELAAVL